MCYNLIRQFKKVLHEHQLPAYASDIGAALVYDGIDLVKSEAVYPPSLTDGIVQSLVCARFERALIEPRYHSRGVVHHEEVAVSVKVG